MTCPEITDNSSFSDEVISPASSRNTSNTDSNHDSALINCHLPPSSTTFKTAIINARSINNKVEDIGNQFRNANVSLALVCKTWERDQLEDDIEQLEQTYSVTWLSKRRRNGRGGGVSIVFDNNFASGRLLDVQSSLETVWAIISPHQCPTRPIITCCFYSSPTPGRQPPTNAIQEHICDVMSALSTSHPNAVFLCGGDINRQPLQDIVALDLNREPFIQVVDKPSREDALLIQAVTNLVSNGCQSRPPLSGDTGNTSDHRVIDIELQLPKQGKRKWLYRKTRPFSDGKAESFEKEFGNVRWKRMFNQLQTADEQTNIFHSILDGLIDKHFPIKVTKIRYGDPLYYDESLKRLKKRVDRVYKRNGNPYNYRRRRAVYRKKLRKKKRDYYKNIIENTQGNNTKAYHSAIFDLVRNGGRYEPKCIPNLKGMENMTNDQDKAEFIAEQFQKVTENHVDIDIAEARYEFNGMSAFPRLSFEDTVNTIKSMKLPRGCHTSDPPRQLLLRSPHLNLALTKDL